MESISFLGPFQVWSYTVSHGQLLLRSTKSELRRTQIDILFSDVTAILLPALIVSPTIKEVKREDGLSGTLSANSRLLLELDSRVFRIRCENFEGYVFAGSVQWAESELEYFEKSPLLQHDE